MSLCDNITITFEKNARTHIIFPIGRSKYYGLSVKDENDKVIIEGNNHGYNWFEDKIYIDLSIKINKNRESSRAEVRSFSLLPDRESNISTIFDLDPERDETILRICYKREI